MGKFDTKKIKDSELLTARLLGERLKGNFDVHTKHTNQTIDSILKLNEVDIISLTNEDLETIGEYINKVQELIMLIETNDVSYFTKILEIVPEFRKKYNKDKVLNMVSKANYNTRETYNLRIKAYSKVLELNINTCHNIINKYKSDEISEYNNLKLHNLLKAIYSGLSPEEIRIIFDLSKKEVLLLQNSLYIDRNKLFEKLGEEYTEWQSVYETHSQEHMNKLNEILRGERILTEETKLNYKEYLGKMFDIKDKQTAINAAELTVKFLFYLQLYPAMSLSALRAQLEEVTNKEHKWSKTQLAEIKALGKTKSQYVKEIKEILKDKTEDSLLQMKGRTIGAICCMDDDTVDTVTNMYVMLEPNDISISFEDITKIFTLMRTNIKTECIQYMYMLDDDTIQLFKQLFKARA